MTRLPPFSLATALAAVVVLAGCDAVGDGVAPSGIVLEPNFEATGLSQREAEEARQAFRDGDAPFRITECLPASFRMVLEFDNGSRENATRRSPNVRYESSNPEVVQAANRGEIPFIGEPADDPQSFFPQGALVPRSPGTATITARFSNFETSMEVEVQPVGDIDPFVDMPDVLAPNGLAEIVSNATVNGQTLSVSNAAAVGLTDINTGEDSTALREERSNDGRLFLRGLLPAENQQVTLDFEICDRQFQRELRVEQIAELQLAREADDGQPMAINFSELLEARAIFADGSEQLLTRQIIFERPDEQSNLLAFFNTQTRSNSLALPLSGAEGDEAGEEVSGTGGIATVSSTFDQDASAFCDDIENDAQRQNCRDNFPDGVQDQPPVDATPLDLPIRPGLARGLQWEVPANDDGERILEIPQDCTAQPGVMADIELFLEDDSYVMVSRDVTRGVNYLIGDEQLPDNGDNGENGDNGDGSNDDEPADPVIEVVPSSPLGSNLNSGTITAVGEIGEEERLRAVLVQTGDVPGFEDEDDEIQLSDEITVRIVDRADCALVGEPGVLE